MALEIPFFDKKGVTKNIKIKISERGLLDAMEDNLISLSDLLWFSREFLMLERLYTQSMVDNTTKDGKFDCIKIAKDFGTSYMKVLTRGEDLEKWH